jgi:hypothetical protein
MNKICVNILPINKTWWDYKMREQLKIEKMMNKRIAALHSAWEAKKGRLKARFPKLSEDDLESLKPKKMLEAQLELKGS